MARAKTPCPVPLYTVGQDVRTLWWTPGPGASGIPAESIVRVVEVSHESYRDGRRTVWPMPRYRVEWRGGLVLWVYQDVLELPGVQAAGRE